LDTAPTSSPAPFLPGRTLRDPGEGAEEGPTSLDPDQEHPRQKRAAFPLSPAPGAA